MTAAMRTSGAATGARAGARSVARAGPARTVAARADAVPRASVAVAGIGRIYLWNGGSLWLGRSVRSTGVHAHHAIQITLPRDAPVGLRPSEKAAWGDYEGAIVRPHEPHQFDGRDGRVVQLFVEPETAFGRVLLDLTQGSAITPLARGQVRPLIESLYDRYESARDGDDGADEAAMEAASKEALGALACCAPQARRVDPRIARVLDALRRRLDHAPTLAQAAALVHLSPGRFRHLFVEQTGTSFRAYLVWLRLQAALAEFNRGINWTRAAHVAGFSDSPHLSRSFRRVFGLSPVMLVRE